MSRPSLMSIQGTFLTFPPEKTMSQPVNEHIKSQLIDDFNAIISGTEQLLQFVSDESGEKATALRDSLEKTLSIAKNRVQNFQQTTSNRLREAAISTDECMHKHPWQAIGIVAGLGVIAGVVTAQLLHDRQ